MCFDIRCPKCNSIYSKNLLDNNFNLMFQCTDCGHIWYPCDTHGEETNKDADISVPISSDLSANTINIERLSETFVIDCKELQFNINDVELKTDSNFFEKFDTLVINGITYKKVK